jgi:UDP-N-acetylmuramoylalanine--D-glutamate ligase
MKNIFKGKKVIVVGLARSGLAASLLLKKLGAEVWVSDFSQTKDTLKNSGILQKNYIKDIELGRHSLEFVRNKDLMVISPGVSGEAKPIIWAKKYNIPIISEMELASLVCPAPILAVTGSNGKSTVTTLLGQIFKKAGIKTFVCGNIGRPFAGEIEKVDKNSVVILETSSFQLEYIDKFKPKLGIILNVSPNHLDRYKELNDYVQTKWLIFKNQLKADFAILNYSDLSLRKLSRRLKSKILFFGKNKNLCTAYLSNDFIYIKNKKFCSLKEIKIKGKHNLENTMVSILAARIFKIKDKVIKEVLRTFKGLEHRIEYVRTLRGVDFINDSKATSVGATIAAINTFSKPIVLIAGGRDKGSDFSLIRQFIPHRIKGLVLVGEARKKIRQSLNSLVPIKEALNFKEAITMAYGMANPGEIVLLSPMCASFDMFHHFEHRGEVFKKIVKSFK